MKKLEELGISPWPWGAYYIDRGFSDVHAADDTLVSCVENPPTEMQMADTKLIAAAPDMYNALYNLVHLEKRCLEFSNSGCDGCPLENTDCLNQIMIIVQAAEAALAKASGEEAHQ